MKTNDALIKTLLTGSLEETGAKKMKMEARSSSHTGIHIDDTIMEQGFGLGESSDEEEESKFEIEL